MVACIRALSAETSDELHTPASCDMPILRLVNKRCNVRIWMNWGDEVSGPKRREAATWMCWIIGWSMACKGPGSDGSSVKMADV
jgi:hypothetical protein